MSPNKWIGVLIAVCLLFSAYLVFVPGPSQAPELTYLVSGCQEQRELTRAYEPAFGAPVIAVQEDSITLSHQLSYVCCADIKLEWERAGDLITVIEVNEGEMCRCMCEYDVSASIGPLEAGAYTVQVYGVRYQSVEPELLKEEQVNI